VKLDALVRDTADVTGKWLLSKFQGLTLREIQQKNKVLQSDVTFFPCVGFMCSLSVCFRFSELKIDSL